MCVFLRFIIINYRSYIFFLNKVNKNPKFTFLKFIIQIIININNFVIKILNFLLNFIHCLVMLYEAVWFPKSHTDLT